MATPSSGALATRLAVVAALLASLIALQWLDRDLDLGRRLRARLLLGVPWGTLVSVLFVLAVYLLIQGGAVHWADPVTIPYHSWSYFYPLGVATAAFAHAGPAHLLGNLISAAALGSLAEYAWGHFPEKRGASSFSSAATNPYVRAFVAVPAAVLVVGLLTSLLSWGPLIGFSGAVFAFAGFALVRYPLGTVIALSARDVLGVVYRALRDPVVVASAEPSFGGPWWAGISVQGHFLGLFLGLIAGTLALRRRSAGPARIWAGGLLVATSLSLWALWWFRGNATYVLYRGAGAVFVVALAGFVAFALRARASGRRLLGVPRRQVALLVLVFPVLVVGFAAVPLNLQTVEGGATAGPNAIEVRDYTVYYAENVTNRMTSAVDLSAFGETTQVQASGVIVTSESRHLWVNRISRSRLAFAGRAHVVVGGPGWREAVGAAREGWRAAGNGTAYKVYLHPPGNGSWRLVHRSPPVRADPVVGGANTTIRPTRDGFSLVVTRNGTRVGRTTIPAENATRGAGGLRFVRRGDAVYALANDTRVRIATKETYRG
ncbi:MAG: rhomboid family intramembrane serine protease [Halobacteriales archaeon]